MKLFPSFLRVLCAFLFVVPFAQGQVAMDRVLSLDGLWSMDQDAFQKTAVENRLPFRWNSQARESALASRVQLSLLSLPLVEMIVRFEVGKVAQVTAVIYSRGDAGEMTREAYEALLRKTLETMDGFTQKKFTARGKDAANAVKAEGVYWKTDQAHYVVEYSFTKEVKSRGIAYRPEFIRLEMTPPQKALGLLASATAPQRARFTGSAHVKRDAATGDVWLADVPMVDQGQKGYCVVASSERVMRYYGAEVDQHELAQVANSSSGEGTSFRGMYDALKKLSARLRVRVRDLERTDVKDLLALRTEYNRAAKKADAPLIPEFGPVIDMGMMYQAMQGPLLQEVRTRNKSDLGRFQRSIQTEIDKGIPILWSVQLGLFPEPGVPQSGGGHMRLIIGYNLKTQELLYSDSWGAGHERKRMPMGTGWTITTGALTIEPL